MPPLQPFGLKRLFRTSGPFSMFAFVWHLLIFATMALDLTTLWIGNVTHATSHLTMRWYLQNLGAIDGCVDVKMKHRGQHAGGASTAAFVRYDSEAAAARAKELAHRFKQSPDEMAWTVRYANLDTKAPYDRRLGGPGKGGSSSSASSSTVRHVAVVWHSVDFMDLEQKFG